MVKSKKRLLAIGGVVIGLVTLRALRKRRSDSAESEPIADSHEDPKTPAGHAAAAAEHARLAAETALKTSEGAEDGDR